MKHLIIVKFNDSVNLKNIVEPIKKLFSKSLEIDGITKVEVFLSNSNKPNRYDLMIEMLLTKEALTKFDNSDIHKQWKAEYGRYIINKTIFDCE